MVYFPHKRLSESKNMQYTTLGKTDIEVSKICLGCMSLGEPSEDFHLWTLNQEQSTEMIRQALDYGINFFDTANCYAHGTSEQFIGNALKKLGIPRNRVVLASKVFYNDGGLSREAIFRELEGSLKRLGTDYLDLYQIHRFDYHTPMEETMQALHDLVTSGKVRAIGASAMYGYQFHNLQIIAEQNGWTTFSTLQNHYNLLYREDERELIPVAKQYNVSQISYSPLAGGHLTRRTWHSDSARSRTDKILKAKYDTTQNSDISIVERVAELADRYGVSMSEIALAWQFKRGVASPIVGTTRTAHLSDAVKAVDFMLSDDDAAYLEALYVPHKIMGAIAPK